MPLSGIRSLPFLDIRGTVISEMSGTSWRYALGVFCKQERLVDTILIIFYSINEELMELISAGRVLYHTPDSSVSATCVFSV
jgi:hypothetical protein